MENANLQAVAADIIVALNALGSVVKLYDSNFVVKKMVQVKFITAK